MKQIHVGVFRIGHMNIDLYALPNEGGGEFYCVPDETSLSRIKVGLKYNHWDEVVAVLLHEAMEFAFSSKDVRFKHTGKLNCDSSDCIFVFNHSQFGDVCSEVAMLVTECLPKLAAIYKKHAPK